MSAPSSTEIERLLFHFPAIAQKSDSEWARGFAASILKQSRRRSWRPSPKQTEIMRRLVSDLFIYAQAQEGDFDLIE
ncbi:MAG: hypothetical protein AAGI03_09470 [Pseudomonadota bacterium]